LITGSIKEEIKDNKFVINDLHKLKH
jgi:hypothetical protein